MLCVSISKFISEAKCEISNWKYRALLKNLRSLKWKVIEPLQHC